MLNLVYWSEDNFGDALSPLLIEELSGEKTRLKAAYLKKVRRFIKSILYLSPKQMSSILFPWQNNILGVGSVITCGNSKSKVWGSGFMSEEGVFHGKEIFAVRGPLTAKRLVDQGFPKCDVYGDPALLLPLWIKPSTDKKKQIGIVPHWKETDFFIDKFSDRYKVIDLRTKNAHKVVEDITSCEYILSTSLHGIIVAHAYNIPSLWIKKGYIETDGFKFADYFGSVGIPTYEGFTHIDDVLTNEQTIHDLFNNNADKSLISASIEEIQSKLISSAPFPIRKKYKEIFN